MTEKQLRQKVVSIMTGWLGCKESDGSHKKILDIYNSHSPLPRGVKMLDTYAWCAATVSAAFIKAGLTEIGFVECSCSKMIDLYKAKGRWKEDDNYKPAIGDLVMYDWNDNGKGDCTGAPEHVGMVVGITGSKLKILEGNKNDAVAYRSIAINGKFIRGYCLPDYASKATSKAPVVPKVDYAKSGLYTPYAKVWTVTAKSGLRLRRGAGTSKGIITTLPYNERVTCYGYYTEVQGVHWLLVRTQDGKTGYCSKQYLK